MIKCSECPFWESCDIELDTDILLDPNRTIINGVQCKAEWYESMCQLIDNVGDRDNMDEMISAIVEEAKKRGII